MNATIDTLTGGQGGFVANGSVAARLLANGMNVNSLRTNDVLRKDEWVHYDTAIVEIARERLIGVADLLSRGLRYDLPNALGTTKLEWEKISDMDPADLSMSGVTPGSRDRQTFELESMPIPLVHKDFSINIRTLLASRTTGQSLDVTQAAMASRLVSERIENILFNGATVGGTNGTIYGYLTAPDRNTGAVTATWATATGEQIVTDVIRMIDAAVADNMYGPYMLYVPVSIYTKMGNDFKANSDKTIIQRVKEIPGIIDVRPSSRFIAPNVVLVQMTTDVVDMVVGQQPTAIMWDSNGGMTTNFKVMSIMVPRIKSDMQGQSGIVHFS